jgi:uncharacterized protein YkwD
VTPPFSPPVTHSGATRWLRLALVALLASWTLGLFSAGRPGVAPSSAYAATAPARAAAAAPAPSSARDDPAAIRRRMVAVLLDETNRERAERHLPDLTLSAELTAAAQAHAEDMLARGYFSHENPEGESSAERVFRIAPRAIVLSVRENILKTQGHEDDAPHVRAIDIIAGWMGSSGHRQNLLAEDVAQAGFGVVSRMEKGRLVEWSVQVLGRIAGNWSEPPRAVRVPERLRARLTVPVEFFLEDTAHPKRRYKDPYDAARSWVGGLPLVVVPGRGTSLVELPRLDPGRYRLLGRLAHDDGYQTLREIRILGAFEQG